VLSQNAKLIQGEHIGSPYYYHDSLD
jgi:hypothetical protein